MQESETFEDRGNILNQITLHEPKKVMGLFLVDPPEDVDKT